MPTRTRRHTPTRPRGRTAAGVAIGLRQDDAVEFQRLVERLGTIDGVLTRHRVGDENRLVRSTFVVDLTQLAHELFVDREPARRVEDHDADVPRLSGRLDPVLAAELLR